MGRPRMHDCHSYKGNTTFRMSNLRHKDATVKHKLCEPRQDDGSRICELSQLGQNGLRQKN